jgi:hypothetical protein
MKAGPDALEAARSHFFDTSNWGPFCDVTLTLKQARQSERGAWVKIDDYPCRQAFRHFMNLLTELYMELLFAGMTNVFVYYPSLRRATSARPRYVHGSVARRADGIFIVQLNCRRISMLLSWNA